MLYRDTPSLTGYVLRKCLPNLLMNSCRCFNDFDLFGCLVKFDAETLNDAKIQINTQSFYGTYTFVPIVDGQIIVERPSATLKSGTVNGVHYLVSISNNLTRHPL